MLFGHGILFMAPDKIWKFIEGGLVDDFVPFDKDKDDDKKQKARKFINLSKSQNRVYFTSFLVCEVLNFGVGIINFFVMDTFLNGKFSTYGTDVVTYMLDAENKKDPMCSAFPTLVSCEYYTGAVNGQMDVKNHICILSQNIVNEKIYLILWFWILILFGASMMMLLYRCCTILVPSFREKELLYRARKGRSNAIEGLRMKISLSQWFILSQIGRNSKSRDFNQFLRQLQEVLGEQTNTIGNNVELRKINYTEPANTQPLLMNGSPA